MYDRIYIGTEKDFENIVNTNKLIVYSTVMANLYGTAEVDDIVQETFIYAYYNFQTLRDTSKLTGWLCGIARNKSRTFNKKYGKTVGLDDFQDNLSTMSAEEATIENYNRLEIMKSVSRLSEKLRETVTLYYIAEKSTREISEILAIPEGTVRFRLAEARKKLKIELKELMDIMSDEKKEIADNELYGKVQENIKQAYNYLYTQHLPQKASELCDETIEMIEKFKHLSTDGKTPEVTELLYKLYYAKAESLIGVERIKALDYYKKALEVVEQSGDLVFMAKEYKNYAMHLSNAKRDKSLVLEYHQKSIETAKKCDDELVYVSSLAAYANDLSEVMNGDRGLPQFEEVLKYKDKLLQNSDYDREFRYFISYGYYNALSAVKEKGRLNNADYLFSAFYRAEENGNIISRGNFCSDYTPWRFNPIFEGLSDDIAEGYKIEWESNSWFTYNTVKTTKEVVNMSEEITVLGKKFNNCIHIRRTEVLNDDENDTSRGAALNKEFFGIHDTWYAPNVGIVKYVKTPIKGENFSIELDEYTVNNKNQEETNLKKKYFPVTLGNKWKYKSIVESTDEFEYDNLYEVILEKDGNHYISYWAYAYKK